jgi:hypothetical protein
MYMILKGYCAKIICLRYTIFYNIVLTAYSEQFCKLAFVVSSMQIFFVTNIYLKFHQTFIEKTTHANLTICCLVDSKQLLV